MHFLNVAMAASAIAVVIGLASSQTAKAQATPTGPLNVVVTLKPVHALAIQVLEGVAEPSLIVGGTASPHTYALKPSDAKRLNDADIVVRVSETLEPFTAKVVRALPKTVDVLTLDAAPGVRTLSRRTGPTFEAHAHAQSGKGHAHGHSHGSSGGKVQIDGHTWLDPMNAKAFVAALARAATAKRPAAAAQIAANATKATARLDALDAELSRTLESAKGKPYIVFHDAFQYLEARYGLSPAGAITVDPEVPPSAKRLADLRARLKTQGVSCAFSEPGFETRVIQAVTEGTGARTATLDPEALTVTAGADAYDTLMRGLATGIATCLAATN